MPSRIESIKIKAKLLQKAKKNAGKPVQLKEAYDILAKSAGFPSWREHKAAIENSLRFGSKIAGPQMRVWFASHKEAKEYVDKHGGVIIPHEKDFYVGDDDFLASIGLKPNDRDLAQVGYDWSNPKDKSAFEKLLAKIKL